MITKAKKKSSTDEQLAKYDAIFEQIKSFTDTIHFTELQIDDARGVVAKAKEMYDEAKSGARRTGGRSRWRKGWSRSIPFSQEWRVHALV